MYTLLMPYTVVGRMMVRSGVASRGVVGPNTAIVEGMNTRRPFLREASSTFSAPRVLTLRASCGFCSPMADRMDARCTTPST